VEEVLKRFVVGLALVLGLLGFAGGTAQADDHVLTERVLGKEDAPVTIIEYASLTCSHCATFHQKTLPVIKKKYIETGKVKMIFRDFPFDRLGLAAAQLARCVPEKRYFGFLDVLFSQQESWARASDPLGALMKLARLAGLSKGAADACLANQNLVDEILKRRVFAEKQWKINSTPSFIVGDKKVVGNVPFAEFEEAIEAASK